MNPEQRKNKENRNEVMMNILKKDNMITHHETKKDVPLLGIITFSNLELGAVFPIVGKQEIIRLYTKEGVVKMSKNKLIEFILDTSLNMTTAIKHYNEEKRVSDPEILSFQEL